MSEPTAEDHKLAFRKAMDDAGLVFKGKIVADGRIQRVHIEGQSKGTRNGWYVLHLDGVPAGAFGCKKTLGDQSVRWSAKGMKPLSRSERQAYMAKIKEDKERRAAEEAARHERAERKAQHILATSREPDGHPYLARKRVKAYAGVRVVDWPREWVDRDGEVHTESVKNTLVVPILAAKGRVVSLQAIFPDKNNVYGRDKHFLDGGQKQGCYFLIGAPTDLDGKTTLVFCEGYATGASIHEATGLAVVVCFDAYNLVEVAKRFRAARPDLRQVIAADNDRWTKTPIANPGVSKASEAANACAGVLIVPEFQSLDGQPTDFNDLAVAQGLDEVCAQVFNAILPPAPPVSQAAVQAEASAELDDDHGEIDPSGYFTILGYDHDVFHVYQHEKKQILRVTQGDLASDAKLFGLASLQWWERTFPGEKGMNKRFAMNWFTRAGNARGIFDPSKIRGRGAWIDDGRQVFHFGAKLVVANDTLDVHKIKSQYIYELGRTLQLPGSDPMSNEDGAKIVALARQFRWKQPASALLLCGWVALAPICGALNWRPHAWLTGGAGCGKTTILKEFAKFLMGSVCLMAQGYSTEAGIRQKLGSDALPVLFDESEQNNDRDIARIQGVLALMRQSSSESDALTLKGTLQGSGMDFLIRSMFLLCSIQVGIKQQADHDRIAKLELRSKREKGHQEAWPALKKGLDDLHRDKELPARLLRRSLNLLPITLKNIETFSAIVANRLGTQREGDQYGTLLAGYWSLEHDGLVAAGEAEKIVDSHNWETYLEESGTEEATKALNVLLGSHVRLKTGLTVTCFELIASASGQHKYAVPDMNSDEANANLKRHGMKVSLEPGRPIGEGKLLLENSSKDIETLLANTPFAAGWRDQLLRYEGAERYLRDNGEPKKERFAALPMACIFIRLSSIFTDDGAVKIPVSDEELPF